MTTVQHRLSPDYPNGKEETRKMFEYAAEIGLWDKPLAAGDRVEIMVGGYATDTGRIIEVDHDPSGAAPWLTIMLDTLHTLRGYRPTQLRLLARKALGQ